MEGRCGRCGEQTVPRPAGVPVKKSTSEFPASHRHRLLGHPTTLHCPLTGTSLAIRQRYLKSLKRRFSLGRYGLSQHGVKADTKDPGFDPGCVLEEVRTTPAYRSQGADSGKDPRDLVQCIQRTPEARECAVAEGAQLNHTREAHLRLPQCSDEASCVLPDAVLGGMCVMVESHCIGSSYFEAAGTDIGRSSLCLHSQHD